MNHEGKEGLAGAALVIVAAFALPVIGVKQEGEQG